MSSEIVAGRFKVGLLLARSTAGTTHLGHDMKSGAACVIKRFPLDGLDEPARTRIGAAVDAERDRLLALCHPHLARVLACQVLSDGGPPTLVVIQQQVEGKNLDKLALTEQKLRQGEVVAVGQAVARALQHVHEEGLVHGEVRPSNVLRTPFGKVFLVDLGGLAHRIGPPSRKWDPPDEAPSPARDVYALGTTLVFLLTHQDPSSLLADGRIDHRRAARVTPALATVLDRMLDPDPAKRFQTGREVAVALAALVPAESGGQPWWVAAGIGVAALVLIVALVARHRTHDRGETPIVAASPAHPAAHAQPGPQAKRAIGGARAVAGAATMDALRAAVGGGALHDETALAIPATGVWGGAAASDAWRMLLASPDLAGIEELRIEARLTRAALGELVACQTLGSLRALSFSRSGIGDDGVLSLAEAGLARQLESLELVEEDLSETAAHAIASSSKLSRLRTLRLTGNRLGEGGAAELARSRTLRGLEVLDLGTNQIGDGAVRTIVAALEAGGLPVLRRLSLVGNGISGDGASVLAAAHRPFEYLLQPSEPHSTAAAVASPPPPQPLERTPGMTIDRIPTAAPAQPTDRIPTAVPAQPSDRIPTAILINDASPPATTADPPR